jgi:hypothetical protein
LVRWLIFSRSSLANEASVASKILRTSSLAAEFLNAYRRVLTAGRLELRPRSCRCRRRQRRASGGAPAAPDRARCRRAQTRCH